MIRVFTVDLPEEGFSAFLGIGSTWYKYNSTTVYPERNLTFIVAKRYL
jgi:hypothetical protein